MTILPCRFLQTLAVVCLLGGCQTPMQTGSQCVVEPGFLDAESTYRWHQGNGLDLVDKTGYVGPLVADGLRQAAVQELAGKGFTYVDEADTNANADINVSIMLTLRTRRELVSLEINDSPCDEVDCWERIDTNAGTRMDIRTIGFLAADIFYQGEPIWRGWVERTLYPKDRDASAEVIAEAIPRLFDSFPP